MRLMLHIRNIASQYVLFTQEISVTKNIFGSLFIDFDECLNLFDVTLSLKKKMHFTDKQLSN